jgi:hypothetical protein
MITENMKKLIESNGSGGQQTGAGTYISPELESGWGEDDDWDCGIFVDPDAWDAQNKAWMPESWVSPPAEGEEEDGGECLNLWWEGDGE